MFDFIRTHQRLMQLLLLLLIFPSFALFGVESYVRSRDANQAIATAGGHSVTATEFDAAYREQLDRMRRAMGAQFDSKLFDTPAAKQGVLDRLITERVIADEAANKKLAVTDQRLQQAIVSTPGVLNADGKFDIDHYKALLMANGLTAEGYQAGLRKDLLAQQVGNGISQSAFAPKTLAARLSDIASQERETQELSFKAADFAPKVVVDDSMLKAYYDSHSAEFQLPEQASAEYLVLNLDAVMSQIAVSDADVKAYYDSNLAQFTDPEQRRARHILVAVGKDATEQQKAAAKAKAENLLAQVRQNPSKFGEIAQKNSDDDISAPQGGDLNFFVSGKKMLATPAIETAAFKLAKPGDISDVVPSEFGYHIVQLTDIKPQKIKPLEQVKSEIADLIRKQQAQKKFSEMAETFSNTVYEQADSLQPAAGKLKLKIETANGLTRQPNPSVPANLPYNNAKFLTALFSADSIKTKRNTEAVEVAPNTLISGRITNYRPVSLRPFDEVKSAVHDKVVQQEAAKMARKAGEEKLAALKAKDDTAGFGAAKTVSREKAGDMDRAAVVAVLKADVSKLPAFVGVEMGDKGYSIYRIAKVGQPEKMDEARRQAERQEVGELLAQQETAAYLEGLKQKAKVKILKPFTAQDTQTDSETAKK